MNPDPITLIVIMWILRWIIFGKEFSVIEEEVARLREFSMHLPYLPAIAQRQFIFCGSANPCRKDHSLAGCFPSAEIVFLRGSFWKLYRHDPRLMGDMTAMFFKEACDCRSHSVFPWGGSNVHT